MQITLGWNHVKFEYYLEQRFSNSETEDLILLYATEANIKNGVAYLNKPVWILLQSGFVEYI